jgi:hypothetical protein
MTALLFSNLLLAFAIGIRCDRADVKAGVWIAAFGVTCEMIAALALIVGVHAWPLVLAPGVVTLSGWLLGVFSAERMGERRNLSATSVLALLFVLCTAAHAIGALAPVPLGSLLVRAMT